MLKIRAEIPVLHLRPKNLSRPSMAARTRSSPQVRAIQGVSPLNIPDPSSKPPILIHFTSLANYNPVRDVVSSILSITPPSAFLTPPDVLVIPKPVGPRRFLTALHTAVNRPLIDPYFTPIANSPRSPGGGYFPRTPAGVESVPNRNSYITGNLETTQADIGGYIDAGRQGGTVQARESPALSSTGKSSTPSAEILATPAVEYFSEAVSKMGASAVSGIMVQSPDGRPYGMYFETPSSIRRTASTKTDSRRRGTGRGSISSVPEGRPPASTSTTSSPTQRRVSAMSSASAGAPDRQSSLQPVPDDEESTDSGSATRPTSNQNASSASIRRKTIGTVPSQSGSASSQRRDRSSTSASGIAMPASISLPSVGTTDGKENSPSINLLDLVASPGLKNDVRMSKKAAAIEAKTKARAEAAAAFELAESLKPKPTPAAAKKAATANKGGLIVPPINVLIVEGQC